MKIKNISCTQFAGIRDRDVSLADGINVIYGKNESGKSTVVNLISRTLFQNAKLNRRSDKEFYELYFPGAVRGSNKAGDFADGKIVIETENGIYSLSKEWASDPRCILSTPEGALRDQEKIDEILKEVLIYGEGVYSDILLSSQHNTDIALQTILDASKKTDAKQEISNAVSQAFAENDGISMDKTEQAIIEKIDEIAGKHWDAEQGIPMRKAGRWSSGLGEILKAYYAMEDAKNVLDEISRLEREADKASGDYGLKDMAVCKAEEAYNKFNTFASRLAVQSERKKAIKRIEDELFKISEILINWPRFSSELEKAKILQTEKTNRELLDKYENAKKINDEIKSYDRSVVNRECPSGEEIMQIKTLQRKITSLENKLCGMNLNAAVSMLGNNSVEITSLRTGKTIDISGGMASITEAVKITVPGVIEMQLSPADVDVVSVESEISSSKKIIADIFAKYNVDSVESLETIERTVSETKAKIENAENRLSVLIGSVSFEELETNANSITGIIRQKAEIENDIFSICRNTDVTRFITEKETIITGFVNDYISIDNLRIKSEGLDAELKKAKESVSSAENIPDEYLHISDPEQYLEMLQNDLKSKKIIRDEAFRTKADASSRLEAFKENIPGDPVSEVERTERIFIEQKTLLGHWLHIYEVFRKQRENIKDNPVQDITDNFINYLGIISDGRVSSEFPEADKLNMNIYSDDKLIDYKKLSEGTKETVSLAFRLAVIDHLFPEGGGIIVFDDPFNDMDNTRIAKSCELIRKCAEKHQVIFLTCKEEYISMLNGNSIRF